MILVDKKNYPEEITINLKKHKKDEEVDTKCFVAHDYIQFEGGMMIEDKEGKGYWIDTHLQIPINVMAKLLKKLKTSPFLINPRHYNRKGYTYKDEIVQFEEWHFNEGRKAREQFLIRQQGKAKWITIPKKRWSKDKLKILNSLK